MKQFLCFLVFILVIGCIKVQRTDAAKKKHGGSFMENPFRMNKINLLWEKAQKRLSTNRLADLYAELAVQDQHEVEAKRQKADGIDPTGEHEGLVRSKFLAIMKAYNLMTEGEFLNTNAVEENQTVKKPAPNMDGLDVKKMDKRLLQIWKKAERAGFSDEEMEQLRQEFLHHQQKLEEFNELKNEVDNFESNELSEEKEAFNPDAIVQKKVDMKAKWREIKDNMDHLQARSGKVDRSDFAEPKVAELWRMAQKTNFSEIELESFKEELRHFEHRIQKHEHLTKELEASLHDKHQKHLESNKAIPEDDEKIKKMEHKVSEYGHRVKKFHTELKTRISKATHTEL